MSERNIIIENGATYIRNVEKQVLFTDQVTVNQYSCSKQSEEAVVATPEQPAPKSMADADQYPSSKYDTILFRKEINIPAVKAEVGKLVGEEKRKRDLNIVHWLVVWKVFQHFGFFELKKSQSTFIRWVADVFGWEWKTKKFAGEFIPTGIKDISLDEWSLDNICSQRPQAELYLTWKNKLVDAFIEEKNGRRDCKEQFCAVWFDTQRGR